MHSEVRHKLGSPYLHMDTIGLGDNRLKYDDSEIMNQIELKILKASDSNQIKRVSAIIVTESFQADAFKLPLVLLQLRKLFGYLPVDSIIVLATKRNMVQNETAYRRRK